MVQILFDTNIVLDVLLNRSPWVQEAIQLWQAIEDGQIKGFLIASTLTDIFYIIRRASSIQIAHDSVKICLETFDIVAVDRAVLEYAHQMTGSDFEDNVQIAGARLATLDGVVTRDVSGFQDTILKAWTPADLIRFLQIEADQNN